MPYPWLTPELEPLDRPFGIADVAADVERTGTDTVVLVQAAGSFEDTEAMIGIADRWSLVGGIVAWAPLDDSMELGRVLERYAADERIVGLRHQIHDEPDPDWIVRPAVLEGLRAVARAGLTFDVVAVTPRHLEHVPAVARQVPDLRIVIDHLAKPPIASAGWEPWAGLLAASAAFPTVYAKISGLDTAAADPSTYRTADLQPYVDWALEHFGAGRLMYGSDWPVSTLAGGYLRWRSVVDELLSGLSDDERAAILGRTAEEFYALSPTGSLLP